MDMWTKKTDEDNKLKPLPNFITPEEFAESFKITDEMTSPSPSGLHYTLWKAIAEKEQF